eukprot:1151027-Pelagomonas_calceolata.AAC.2
MEIRWSKSRVHATAGQAYGPQGGKDKLWPRKGSRFIFSHPSGSIIQPCSTKGHGSLFDMGCTKAVGFGAAQHGGGSCWERGGSRAGQLGACIRGKAWQACSRK